MINNRKSDKLLSKVGQQVEGQISNGILIILAIVGFGFIIYEMLNS